MDRPERNTYFDLICPHCCAGTSHILNTGGKKVCTCDNCKRAFVAELILTTEIKYWKLVSS